jgi:ubiquitin C-terminal hydrolase
VLVCGVVGTPPLSRRRAAQVSPHEFLQAVVSASKKRFRIDRQGDPVEFLAWFLHELHRCGARVRAHVASARAGCPRDE